MQIPSNQTPVLAPTWFERTWRWWVLSTLFLATFINYFDRQTLSVAIEPISREFGLSNEGRGELLAAFVYSYAFAHLFIGSILDRVKNIRFFFPVMVIGWTISTVLVGLSTSYTQVLWLRYTLGFFEAANFPLCLLLIARIFPPRERSLAAGIFNSGAVFATLAAPKLVIYFSTNYNWRYSFLATGFLGILWLIPWLIIFRKPEQRAINWPDYRKQALETETEKAKNSIGAILKLPAFWGVALIGVGIMPGWYFMSQWLPSFFTQAFQMPYDQALGNKLTVVYFAQDLGLWLSGILVWWLAKRGLPIISSRKAVIAGAYLLMMSIVFLPQVQSISAVIALLCVYVFGLAAWQANQQAFKQDVLPRRIATVAALVGFAETGFSAFVVQKVGLLTQESGGYNAIFLLLAGFFTFSIAVVFLFLRPKWLNVK